MGRRSIEENKNFYWTAREEAGFTREEASAATGISTDLIDRIEHGRRFPLDHEVMAMAKAYNRPEMTNYFCSHDCLIGRKYVPEVKEKSLSQITLELLSSINDLNSKKDRMIEMAADGQITEDERTDFYHMKEELEELSQLIDSLKLWIEKTMEK